MPLSVATHHGPFHADDVTAFALIRAFLDPAATVVRTRDTNRLADADLVFDVGGTFDPATRRFDHHQVDYQGPLSSAGMVLDWLETEGHVAARLAARLREDIVAYVDDVDNGRRKPVRGTPCLPALVGMIGEQAQSFTDFDRLFERAAELVLEVVRGIEAGLRKEDEAAALVHRAMDEAERAARLVVLLDRHLSWKAPYFARGGASHPTEFVLFPGEGDVRVVAIPPEPESFGQKRSFPSEWAGLSDEALVAATGVPGAVFCHKNRFIAVFRTHEAAVETLEPWGLWGRPEGRRQ